MKRSAHLRPWECESPQSLWEYCYSDLWPGAPGPTEHVNSQKGVKPLAGDPSRQNTGGFAPEFFAYWDQKKRCTHCGASYLFTASEQKFWYEELRFYTRSEPTGCPDCRRKLRHYRRTNRKIAELLRSIDQKDWQALRELGHLYLQLGSKRTALETLRRAKNLCIDEASLETLRKDIEEAKFSPPVVIPRKQFSYLRWIDSKTQPEELKGRVADVEPSLSEEGREILAEIVRRWTRARYGE